MRQGDFFDLCRAFIVVVVASLAIETQTLTWGLDPMPISTRRRAAAPPRRSILALKHGNQDRHAQSFVGWWSSTRLVETHEWKCSPRGL
jgi:hypothetical protein